MIEAFDNRQAREVLNWLSKTKAELDNSMSSIDDAGERFNYQVGQALVGIAEILETVLKHQMSVGTDGK